MRQCLSWLETGNEPLRSEKEIEDRSLSSLVSQSVVSFPCIWGYTHRTEKMVSTSYDPTISFKVRTIFIQLIINGTAFQRKFPFVDILHSFVEKTAPVL